MAGTQEVQDKILEQIIWQLDAKPGNASISALSVLHLAEAWAWLERPDQSHASTK